MEVMIILAFVVLIASSWALIESMREGKYYQAFVSGLGVVLTIIIIYEGIVKSVTDILLP